MHRRAGTRAALRTIEHELSQKRSLDLLREGCLLTSESIVSNAIGNIVLDYLIDLGKFQAELALRADCKDLAERVFARCEALVETLALEMDYQKTSEEPEDPPGWDGVTFPNF